MNKRIILVSGFLFGASALAGSMIAIAAVDSPDQTQANTAFSTASPNVLSNTPVRPADIGVSDVFGEQPDLHLAVSDSGATAYVSKLSDGSICAVLVEPDKAVSTTCGSDQDVASGRVVLRSQNRASDPVYFAGVVPNDVTAVSIDGQRATLGNNAFIAVGSASSDSYSFTSADGRHIDVDMHINDSPPTSFVIAKP